jgi:hypothetical protein
MRCDALCWCRHVFLAHCLYGKRALYIYHFLLVCLHILHVSDSLVPSQKSPRICVEFCLVCVPACQ